MMPEHCGLMAARRMLMPFSPKCQPAGIRPSPRRWPAGTGISRRPLLPFPNRPTLRTQECGGPEHPAGRLEVRLRTGRIHALARHFFASLETMPPAPTRPAGETTPGSEKSKYRLARGPPKRLSTSTLPVWARHRRSRLRRHLNRPDCDRNFWHCRGLYRRGGTGFPDWPPGHVLPGLPKP